MQIDQHSLNQERYEADRKEGDEEFRFEDVAKSMTRNYQKPAPLWSQLS
jgi:hypothetical protein